MIRPEWDIIEKIRAYTHQDSRQEVLRAEYELREQLLKAARECEEIAAAYQQIADELREAV